MKKILLTLAISCLTCAANAETQAINAKISSLGLGLEYDYTLAPNMEVGLAGHYLSWPTLSMEKTDKHPAHKIDVTTKTLGVVGYYYPWPDLGFNVNAGLYYNGNKFAAQVEDHGHWEANETFNAISPSISIGWRSNTPNNVGLGYSFNLGVMYQGTPTMEITKRPDTCGLTDPSCQKTEKLVIDHVHEHTDGFRFWPVISAGLVYRFL